MRHFLYLTNTRLVSITTQGRRIAARREFAVSGGGIAQFERHLADLALVPVHLFTDLAEEDFRLDTIPHVTARDREAILARKLGQIFRNTPFRYAVVQGRETEGRRDDRVLYTAITNPDVLRPWLDVISRHHVPLAGIYSAAVFSSVMLEELDLVFPHTLLVTFTAGGAMRQTYFRDREIKFSRLTPIDPEEGQSLGTLISEETTRTWQYLDSLRHFGESDRLEVCLLLHSSDRMVVQPALRDFAQIQHRILDIEQVSLKLGLKPAPLGSTAEEVFVHLFLLRPAVNHFAAPELRREDMLRKARIAIFRASAGILAAGLAWAGFNLTRAVEKTDQDQRLGQQITQLNREYDQITRTLPSFGVGGSTMRDAVAFYNAAIRGFPTLNGFAVALSGVLEHYPDVRLVQLQWQATDDPKAAPNFNRPVAQPDVPVHSVALAEPSTAGRTAANEPENAVFSGGRYEVALIEGTVRVANNDFRDAVARIDQLAADIGTIPGCHATVVESPLDVRPNVAIQGRHSQTEAPTMDPRFVVRVVRERRPES